MATESGGKVLDAADITAGKIVITPAAQPLAASARRERTVPALGTTRRLVHDRVPTVVDPADGTFEVALVKYEDAVGDLICWTSYDAI